MPVLVLDTSVIFDLERAGLLAAAFKLNNPFVTPDLLYQSELADDIGPYLRGVGLTVVELDAASVVTAQRLLNKNKKLSTADCWALSLAMRGNHRLITGDNALRRAAETHKVDCSGLLWLLDQIEQAGTASPQELADGLTRATRHPRCRLPKQDVEERMARWTGTKPKRVPARK